MAQRTTEIIVGLFIIAGLAALLFLALQVSVLSPMAGVTVGTIESITLDRETFQARVTMSIHKDVDNIPADSAAVIRTSGILGEQYIDISIGGDLESLKEGDTFYSTQSAMNLERMISNFASGR
jgi:phospholipid/cholesterol/gamma-HCH transport system substrate-binding protein